MFVPHRPGQGIGCEVSAADKIIELARLAHPLEVKAPGSRLTFPNDKLKSRRRGDRQGGDRKHHIKATGPLPIQTPEDLATGIRIGATIRWRIDP